MQTVAVQEYYKVQPSVKLQATASVLLAINVLTIITYQLLLSILLSLLLPSLFMMFHNIPQEF